ncbi:CvpA family protein [Virgibacillus sp. MSP4-1]|uniref:CvpA family protein n=1 Tax=Virgibacillus sp. MSP4-1 TaxID=2700081 RepID=UPI0003A82E3A|nr:CvpA family protein [Virgibacillus sp. MSP4-1]QHS22959.1 CvpA family protein [Virgibacillus sp. MSP4-1]
MVDIILLAILLVGLFIGLKRGFIMQVMHLTGFIIAFIIAALYYDKLAPILTMWIPYPDFGQEGFGAFFDNMPLETAFYNGIAFVILFFIVKIVLQIIANMLDFIAELPILHSVNGLLGAVLGFFETYFILFILLYFSALIPIDFIQQYVGDSSIAQFMIEHTPLFSEQITNLWDNHISEAF